MKQESDKASAVDGELYSRIDKDDEKTDVDGMSSAAQLRTMHEPPARAYYIGPWGDNMSVFAAKMDRLVSPSALAGDGDTRTSGRLDEGDSSRSYN